MTSIETKIDKLDKKLEEFQKNNASEVKIPKFLASKQVSDEIDRLVKEKVQSYLDKFEKQLESATKDKISKKFTPPTPVKPAPIKVPGPKSYDLVGKALEKKRKEAFKRMFGGGMPEP